MLQYPAVVIRHFMVFLLSLGLGACAFLHKVQLAEVDGRKLAHAKKISVKVSETTVDFREAGQIVRELGAMGRSKTADSAADAMETYAMFFQFGPKTGTPVFKEDYVREVPEALMRQCKGGYLTDIISVREARQYPVIKGEIVRIDAQCVAKKGRRK